MSVRRLADETLQPASFAFSNDNQRWADRKIGEYPAGRQQSAVIPLLMRAQDQEGWVTRPAMEAIARMLGMPYIRVLEVATFYTQFQLKPVGTRAHIQVCGTTPCMLRGAEQIREMCQHKIHPEPFTTNADGTLSWEEVECLGACVNAPMVAIFHDTYEDLTPERMAEIIDAFAAGRGDTITPGPQIERQYSAAAGGQTTLTEAPSAQRSRISFPPPAAPAAPPAAAPAPPAAAQAPTTPGRKREVSEEAAPALKTPGEPAKVSMQQAETARAAASESAHADGTPNTAMRPDAVGAESPGGKVDEGRASDAPVADVPTVLFDTPTGAADDLKLIAGVGPAMEKALNGLGITTFAQVARLTEAQIAQLESALGFKGRVARGNWIAQADALASGGVAEYVKRFGKDPR